MYPRRCCATLMVLCVVVSTLQTAFVSGQQAPFGQDGGSSTAKYMYTREYLIQLKTKPLSMTQPSINFDFVFGDPKTAEKKKKRGSRGGVRNRLRRRGHRLPMPSVTLTNAKSIYNKMTQLETLVKSDGDFRRSNLICVTESWLSENKTVELDGFSTVRLDRDLEITNKKCGGGLIMFVNNNWATNVTVREKIVTPDCEILSVSFRPHYLPREFTQVSVILAYVPGPDDDAAADRIAECYDRALRRSADQPVILLGDFNTCNVGKHLPHLHQYVTKKTHEKGNILDKCFVNIPDAYTDRYAPALGRSDHCVIHLLPKYRQLVKREKPVTRVVQQWDDESKETLRGCFEATDWDVFFDETDIDTISDSITSYMSFCEDTVIPKKEIKIYSNTKPWVNKEMSQILREKKVAYHANDGPKQKELEKRFRSESFKSKKEYKNKVEEKLFDGNAKSAWNGLNVMMGKDVKKGGVKCDDPIKFSNDLNSFYARFDKNDFSGETAQVCQPLLTVPNDVFVSESEVRKVLSDVNPRKARGPDRVSGNVLKECSEQLCIVLTRLFQLLLNCHYVPNSWRTSQITPVPKHAKAKELNDFRPIALTSIVCKQLERLVCNHLTKSLSDHLDPLQFAYKAKRGVADATATLLDSCCRHLDKPRTFVRILMMDFSSAFNTIQPHLLLKRLIDLDVSPSLILWTRSFLCDRPQRVIVNGVLSNEIVVNTGAPQGCTLSPLLFSVYTNEMTCDDEFLTLIKFADDMALIARLIDEHSLSAYFDFIDKIATWFDESFLALNITKTKELCIERKRATDPSLLRPVQIGSGNIEQVNSFKYLGVIIDENLTFSDHVDATVKKANQRLYLLRKLRSFNVSSHVLGMVYNSIIQSILSFSIVSWYGHIRVKDRAKINRVVREASKIIGKTQKPLSEIHRNFVKKKAKKVFKDRTHPLHSAFEVLRSGRRLRAPMFKRNLMRFSFVSHAINILNCDGIL